MNSLRMALVTTASALVLACAPQQLDMTGGVPAAGVDRIEASGLPFVRKIDERFQSFQIGMSHLTGGETWRSYDATRKDGNEPPKEGYAAVREARQPADLTNPRLRTLTAALAPLYVRYGGTTSNSVYFQNNDEPRLAKTPDGYSVVLTRAGWKGGIDFAKAVDAKILTGFTVSAGVRDSSGAWTPRTAAPWLAYTRSIGGEIYAAELFNEPNAPEPGRMPKGQSAEDFARDFAAFSSFMRQAAPSVKLAGPGVAKLGIPVPSLEGTTPEQYMTGTPRPKFDIVSYHFYGALAERCAPPESSQGISPAKALSEEWLARPDAEFQRHKALRDRYAPGAPIWITETGAAACGGPSWQPTFLDTFRYLDSHARLAKQGVDAMFTHALISGSNGVIDEKTFMPNADYWAALLWRKLMGTQVLDAGSTRPGLHVYAHCMRGARGGVTVLAINLDQAAASLDVPGAGNIYALTAPELQSRIVLLNGRPLALGPGDTLPAITGAPARGRSVSVAPTSIAFITVPGARNASCSS